MRKILFLLMVMGCFQSLLFADQVYKTVNSDGAITYSDSASTNSKLIKVYPGRGGGSRASTVKVVDLPKAEHEMLSGEQAYTNDQLTTKPVLMNKASGSNASITTGSSGGASPNSGSAGSGSSALSGKTTIMPKAATGNQAATGETELIKGDGYPPLSCQNKFIWERWKSASYQGVNVLPGIAPKDWAILIQDWQINITRLQIILSDANLRLIANGGLDALPKFKSQLQEFMRDSMEHNVDVVLDLHRAEGGAGDSGLLWGSRQLKENYKRVILAFVKELQNYPNVAGVDILNEPTPRSVYTKPWSQRRGTADDWMVLAKEVIGEIRKLDACMPIIVEPVDWAKPFRFSEMEVFDDPFIVYSPHLYAPFEVTHQGINQYPKGATLLQYNMGTTSTLIEYIKNNISEARRFQCKYDKPIYVGEFGINYYATNSDRDMYINVLTTIFEEYGWSWTYHAYKIWDGWMPTATSLAKMQIAKLPRGSTSKVDCD